jgi:uroporphyrinogen-III synthase
MAVDQLEGFTIGVTADRRAAEQTELLHRRGAEVLIGTSVHTENWADESAVSEATRRIIADPPDVLIATTGIGIRSWLSFAESQGMDTELHIALSAARIVARGPKAGGAVSQAGLEVADTEQSEQLDRLVGGLIRGGVSGQVVALQLFGAASPGAVQALEEAGARVITVVVYHWTLPQDVGPAVRLVKASLDGRLEAVTFTSRPALDHLFAIACREGLDGALRSALNRDVVCCCVGPVTAAAARAQGVDGPIFPERGRLGLMVRRLAEVLHSRHRHLASSGPDVVIQGCTVRAGARRVTLTRRERAVLDVLARRPGAIVSRPLLLREVWAGDGGLHVVDITVGRLRHRLQPLGLGIWATRRGYRLETTMSPQRSPVVSGAVQDV